MNNMDEVLKKVLSPTENPSEELNEKIIDQMKMTEKGCNEMRTRNRKLLAVAIAVMCVLIIPVSAYATYKYLLPEEAAKELEDEKLEQAFEQKGTEILQTVTDGMYKVTYLGHVTGESISDRTGSAWELNPDRLYVAVAIERTDGTEIDYKDNIFVSPLVQGLAPWNYNIVTMNGSYMEKNIDGVLYRIIECDNIEVFADRKLYLAVSNTAFFSIEAFHFDEATGKITVNDVFEGTNVLFDLELDSTKADPIKAQEYIEQLNKEWNSDSEFLDDKFVSDEAGDNDKLPWGARYQKELFTDEENGISILIKDNDSHRWASFYDYSQTIFQYYLEVEGDNIETLTFILNKGEFSNFPEHSFGAAEYYGNECSLSYDEQKDRNYLYAISFKGIYEEYGYDAEEVSKLGETDIDARVKIYYDVLNKTISDTTMSLKIKMKDGSEIIKTLSFTNVSGNEKSFWIRIEVN